MIERPKSKAEVMPFFLSSDESLASLISERRGGERERRNEDGGRNRQQAVVAFLSKSL